MAKVKAEFEIGGIQEANKQLEKIGISYKEVEDITRNLYGNFPENIRNVKLFVISKEQFYPGIRL